VHDAALRYLNLAARLALRGAGDVEPNPMVGAVIVKNGRIIGTGHHRKFGGPHAEREALADCRRRGEDPRGSTVYVTLEPCCHHGKQPPCTDSLVEAGVARVIAARPDPNPVSCGGAAVLQRAGIPCEFSDAGELAVRISDPFVKRIAIGLPWVIAKWAQTIDGRIATRTGESRWISGERSRRRVHQLRARVDAIITGMGTVLADDPLLTARGVARTRRLARRVVIDPDLDLRPICNLVRTAREVPTLAICTDQIFQSAAAAPRRAALEAAGVHVAGVPAAGRGVDLRAALRLLAEQHDATNVMLECGAGLLGAMFDADLVDEAIVYIAPAVLADDQAKPAAAGRIAPALSDACRFRLLRARRSGEDLELTYRRLPASRTPGPAAPPR
jgi:diaminohydroxyphosphoribosylaminopyrimidine deaminase/5-amino-6-(5-phosphoribosylamino)uracil reductase